MPRARDRVAKLPLVEPIVPVLQVEPFDDPAYVFEPKYDGFRGLFYLTRRSCCFRSKRGIVLGRFQELCSWVRAELPVDEVILDGEVVALDEHGRPDFRALMANRGDLHYAAFDVLWIAGRDLRDLALIRRKRVLQRLIESTLPVLSHVLTVEERGRDLYRAVERLDLEGIVAKRKGDPYTPQTVWLKVKNRAYTQTEGRWELFQRRRP